MASFFTLPFMVWAGAIAIASPIIIHLLNRRRFKVVEWAAMDFLLLANKKNRRRVQIEDLILLLLRCLAVFFLGLLLSRPFLTNDNVKGKKFERIVLLDDSLSMNARRGNTQLFSEAKAELKKFVQRLAADKSATNYLTVVKTSDITSRVIDSKEITEESIELLLEKIEETECSDDTANYQNGLSAILASATQDKEGVNRLFYMITDLRKADWDNPERDEGRTARALLEEISQKTPLGCYIVDVGQTSKSEEKSIETNLAITSIRPKEILVAGRGSTFEVDVTNFGAGVVRNQVVEFFASAKAAAKEEEIPEIGPGETVTVEFSIPVRGGEDLADPEDVSDQVEFRRIQASLRIANGKSDGLDKDNSGFYAARVHQGTRVLLVDGDPASDEERSETYVLKRAIYPDKGPAKSGFLPTVVGVSQISEVDFSKYEVVYLCDVRQLTESQIATLEGWVAEGGSLVFMVGNKVVEDEFNRQFYFNVEKARKVASSKDASETFKMIGGVGLSPVKLDKIMGDVYQETWANIDVVDEKNMISMVFAGAINKYRENVKFFNYWSGTEQGLSPVYDPVSPIMNTGNHYKFGSQHAKSEVYQDKETRNYREFEIRSKGLEVGAELVISDVLGNFEKYPILLRTDSDATFRLIVQDESGSKADEKEKSESVTELKLEKIPVVKDKDLARYGCWRLRYSSQNQWIVTLEQPEKVRDRGENTQVLARFNSENDEPAIVEKRFGKGRVVAFMFPASTDWSSIHESSANLFLHNQTCSYLSRSRNLEPPRVGDGFTELIDASRFKLNAKVVTPDKKSKPVKATKKDSGSNQKSIYYQVNFPGMERGGFYEVTLTEKEKKDNQEVTQTRLFAANVPADLEGSLQRLELQRIEDGFFGDKAKLIKLDEMADQAVRGAKTHYWKYILFMLGIVLILEQFLGWWFGRRR